MPDDYNFERGPDPWQRLPALAKRLGVQPVAGSTAGRVMIRNREGVAYDLFDLVNALLDKIEAAKRD